MRAPGRGESEVVDAMPRPLASDDARRIASLDFVRGVAVLGILLANITSFAHPALAYYWPPALGVPASEADKVFWLFQFIVINGKMRGLFTVLFGASMALFMERAWARGADRRLQLRRLLWLLGFGMAHYFLLWRGDILALYAVWGIAALPLMRCSAGMLLASGAALYMAMSAIALETGLQRLLSTGAGDERGALEAALAEAAMSAQESYGAMVLSHMTRHDGDFIGLLFMGLFETFPLVLIGMGLYRLGLFGAHEGHSALMRRALTGVMLGTALTIALGLWVHAAGYPLSLTEFVFLDAAPLVRLPVILGLVTMLALAAPAAASTWWGTRIVAAGRLALSNYIGTSLVMTALFHGWGLGLFGSFHRPALLLFVALGWAGILLWSKPWLRLFRYGPLEWLWRCLTYGCMFPLLRDPPARRAIAIAIDSH